MSGDILLCFYTLFSCVCQKNVVPLQRKWYAVNDKIEINPWRHLFLL